MSPTLLGMLNTPEIILILVLALVLFGAKKLPELARGLGHGIKEFKKATRDVQDELSSAMNVEPPYAPPQPPAPVSTPPAVEPGPEGGPAAEPPAVDPPPQPEAAASPVDAVQPAETAPSSEPPKV